MPTEELRLSTVVPAPPARVHDAWLDAREHTAFTGGAATCDPRVGGRFTAWDGYIEGVTLAIDAGRRIVQTWRTTEFPPGAPDSRLEVRMRAIRGGTRVELVHTEIPEGQAEMYEAGWHEYYLGPLFAYFANKAEAGAQPAKQRATAKKSASKKAAKRTPTKKVASAKTTATKAPSATAKKTAEKRTATATAKKMTAKKRAATATATSTASAKKTTAKKSATKKRAAAERTPGARRGR